jgi:hypothetical protein
MKVIRFGLSEEKITFQEFEYDPHTYDQLLAAYYQIPPIVPPSWVYNTMTKGLVYVIPRYRCHARSDPPMDFPDEPTSYEIELSADLPNAIILSTGCYVQVEMDVVHLLRHSLIHYQRANYDTKRIYFRLTFDIERYIYTDDEVPSASQLDITNGNSEELFFDVNVGSYVKVPIAIKSSDLHSAAKPYSVSIVFVWESSDEVEAIILALRKHYNEEYINLTGDTSGQVLVDYDALDIHVEDIPEERSKNIITIVPRLLEPRDGDDPR